MRSIYAALLPQRLSAGVHQHAFLYPAYNSPAKRLHDIISYSAWVSGGPSRSVVLASPLSMRSHRIALVCDACINLCENIYTHLGDLKLESLCASAAARFIRFCCVRSSEWRHAPSSLIPPQARSLRQSGEALGTSFVTQLAYAGTAPALGC